MKTKKRIRKNKTFRKKYVGTKPRKYKKIYLRDCGKNRKNNIKLTIKKCRRRVRNQIGCSNKRKQRMRGGGPLFQPLTDAMRVIEGGSATNYNTLMGNDNTQNEVMN